MSWRYLCETSEVAENASRLVDAGGVRILVVNYGRGFRAMPPICPHMEEPLVESGVVAGCVLTCTKHLWAWDLRNLEALGETEKPLKTYTLKQDGERLLALVDEELTYDFAEEGNDDDDFFNRG